MFSRSVIEFTKCEKRTANQQSKTQNKRSFYYHEWYRKAANPQIWEDEANKCLLESDQSVIIRIAVFSYIFCSPVINHPNIVTEIVNWAGWYIEMLRCNKEGQLMICTETYSSTGFYWPRVEETVLHTFYWSLVLITHFYQGDFFMYLFMHKGAGKNKAKTMENILFWTNHPNISNWIIWIFKNHAPSLSCKKYYPDYHNITKFCVFEIMAAFYMFCQYGLVIDV